MWSIHNLISHWTRTLNFYVTTSSNCVVIASQNGFFHLLRAHVNQLENFTWPRCPQSHPLTPEREWSKLGRRNLLAKRKRNVVAVRVMFCRSKHVHRHRHAPVSQCSHRGERYKTGLWLFCLTEPNLQDRRWISLHCTEVRAEDRHD